MKINCLYKKENISNEAFIDKCLVEAYKYFNNGDTEEKFLPFSKRIFYILKDNHFIDLINKKNYKYRYSDLGLLEKMLLAMFYSFQQSNLLNNKNTKLFINSILEISKKYISFSAHKILNGIIKNILNKDEN